MKRTTTFRIAAFALAGALSALTLAIAMPGGAAFVADRTMPAGNAFETIAAPAGVVEVAIVPARIEVIGVRTQDSATADVPANRG